VQLVDAEDKKALTMVPSRRPPPTTKSSKAIGFFKQYEATTGKVKVRPKYRESSAGLGNLAVTDPFINELEKMV
jgi:hypothetical protein